jgi:hypothetical protein
MPLKKTIRKNKPRKKRDEAFKRMTKSVYEFGKPFVEKAYEVGKPMVQNKMRDIYTRSLKYGQDLGESYRVPKVTNNPSWVDLRKSLNEKVFEMGVTDKEIDIGVYLRGVEAFLKKYESISFSKAEIKQAGHTLMGKDIGSAMENYMETSLKKGITVKTMIEILEYLFSHKLSPGDDTEIEMSESGGRFPEVKENKRLESLKKKMRDLERKADTTSRALNTSKLPRDKIRFAGELNIALRAIADHISNEAEDGNLVTEVMVKYNKLVVDHKKDKSYGHKLTNYFANLLDKNKAQKKKKKKKKTKRRKKHKGGMELATATATAGSAAAYWAGLSPMNHSCVCDGGDNCLAAKKYKHGPDGCRSRDWGFISGWAVNGEKRQNGPKEGKVVGAGARTWKQK